MTLLLIFAAMALLVSFLCSVLEACLLSVPLSYVELLVERGRKAGLTLREMKRNIDRPLAAILTLNTVAHTVGAAGVGAQAAIAFGNEAVGVASAIMTLLVLVLSEIIPKTLGTVHARALAAPAAVLIRILVVICLPIIIPLEWLGRMVGYQRHADTLSRAELLATIHLGRNSGAIRPKESQIASNLIALSNIQVKQVMTPRTVLFLLPESMTVGQAMAEQHPIRFSRIPLFAGDHDSVTGYAPRPSIYAAQFEGREQQQLKELMRPIRILPETASVGAALDELVSQNQQIALVVDEYGGTAGVVTLEDLVETLLGAEIVDETDTVADMQELARKAGARAARSRAPRVKPARQNTNPSKGSTQ